MSKLETSKQKILVFLSLQLKTLHSIFKEMAGFKRLIFKVMFYDDDNKNELALCSGGAMQ